MVISISYQTYARYDKNVMKKIVYFKKIFNLALLRAIPKSISEPLGIIPNRSEKSFVSRWIKETAKTQSELIRCMQIQFKASIRMNLN